jgi:hypothetical protein
LTFTRQEEKKVIRSNFLRSLTGGIVAALVCALGSAFVSSATLADKHDSNTLHKLGKAIEYPVRKAGENTSVAAHRATGSKSVVHRRNGNRTYRSVVTSNGRIYRKYRVGHRRHYRHHSHYRHHRRH